jgi:hypothetical protein
MTQTVFVVHVRAPEGMREYATLLPQEVVSERGLPAHAIVGILTEPAGGEGAAGAKVFTPNPVFVRFMHDVIARHAPLQPALRAEAARVGDGYVYVMDARTAGPAAGVPREDIFGGFQVAGGALVEGSYRVNPRHQLLAARGFFQLGAELHAALMREVEALPAE